MYPSPSAVKRSPATRAVWCNMYRNSTPDRNIGKRIDAGPGRVVNDAQEAVVLSVQDGGPAGLSVQGAGRRSIFLSASSAQLQSSPSICAHRSTLTRKFPGSMSRGAIRSAVTTSVGAALCGFENLTRGPSCAVSCRRRVIPIVQRSRQSAAACHGTSHGCVACVSRTSSRCFT